MRLARFNRHVEVPSLARLGVVLPGDVVADLRAGYALFLSERGEPQALEVATLRVPGTLSALIAANALVSRELAQVVAWLEDKAASDPQAEGLRGGPLFAPLHECRLHAPVRLTNLFVAHGNYASAAPEFTMKPSIAVVGPAREIRLPTHVSELSCAPGLAIVLAKGCRDIVESEAMGIVAGYFVMTNVSAASKANLPSFEAGMYETFAPSGPWLVTRDDVADAMNLAVEMRVNGDLRRRFTTGSMTWPIPRLIASLSRMTLQAGDVIWCGAPAADPDEPPVRFGDHVESVVNQVGSIRNLVVR